LGVGFEFNVNSSGPVNQVVSRQHATQTSNAIVTERPPTAAELTSMVRVALWQDWDPIGVNDLGCPDDEYDSYVGRVCSLLLSGADIHKIRQHLSHIETGNMGLSCPCPDLSHLDDIATQLLAMVGR